MNLRALASLLSVTATRADPGSIVRPAEYSEIQLRTLQGHVARMLQLLERLCLDEELFVSLASPTGEVFELSWLRDRCHGAARWRFGPVHAGHVTTYTTHQLPTALELSPLDDAAVALALRMALEEQISIARLSVREAELLLAAMGRTKLDLSGPVSRVLGWSRTGSPGREVISSIEMIR